jgi:hypothetical protein
MASTLCFFFTFSSILNIIFTDWPYYNDRKPNKAKRQPKRSRPYKKKLKKKINKQTKEQKAA